MDMHHAASMRGVNGESKIEAREAVQLAINFVSDAV
jgi:hypothetical protein